MSYVERMIPATASEIFLVLADGWTYSDWVVGTAHMRSVDPEWPSAGSRLRVQTGTWPLLKEGVTESLKCRPPHSLVVRPKLWPLGELTVEFTLLERERGTLVGLREEVTGGPMRFLRTRLDDAVLHLRNREALRRLAEVVLSKRAGARR